MKGKSIVLAALAAAVLASCSVQPATNVTPTSAQLNARLVNPLEETFRYHYEWAPTIADYDGDVYRTPFQGPAPGAAGRSADFTLAPKADWTDVATTATGLEPGTEYHDRVCGTFVESGRSLCLPGKTFTTPLKPSSGDQVRVVINTDNGYDQTNLSPLIITASSNADGTGGKGTVVYAPLYRFEGLPVEVPVTCMRASGRRAIVRFDRFAVAVFDGGSTAKDDVVLARTDDRAPDDCSELGPDDLILGKNTIAEGRVIVSDH